MDEQPSLPLTQRLTRRHWIAIDVLFAALFASASIVATALERHPRPTGAGWDAVRYVAVVVACVALVSRRWGPRRALYIVTPAILVLVALGVRGPTMITGAAVVYSVAATTSRRTSLFAAALVIGGIVVGAMVADAGPIGARILSLPPVVAVGWLAGENARARRAYAEEMVQRAAEREGERADRALRALADERLRIARDLHDIVAHAMSVVAIRSGVARVVLDTQPDEVREALEIIETTSKRALAEMRLLVGVLRQPEDGAELGPAPGLADLPELIAQVGQAGVDVEVVVDGDMPSLPAGIDLSAYRIIQEALTNVVRHAGPTTAVLTVRHNHNQLEIEVVDQGASASRRAVLTPGEQGHGLVGMRERVGLFGGSLSAAPDTAGFRVFASLPFDEGTR